MRSALNNTRFICLDCEFTGLDPIQDRIIEVAVVLFTFDEVLETYETLIDPEMTIPEASIQIHHITQDMVQGKPKIKEVLPYITEMVGNNILMGHGIGNDIDVLVNNAERENIPAPYKYNRKIDTLRLARSYGESAVNSLEKLREHFNIEAQGAHRAMSDVLVNIEVFKSLARDYKSLSEIFDRLSKPILMKTMPLGKHKGRSFQDVPLEYLKWASFQEFDQDLLFSIRTELKRRKQGNLFTQASNPFSNL